VSNRARYIKAWNHAFNDGDPDAFAGLLAPGYVRHYSQSPGFSNLDSEGLRSALVTVRRGFPDIRSHIDDIVGGDDEFTIRWSSRGTHLDEFLGVPATGRAVSTDGITVCRFQGDLIREEWVAWDLQALLKSLGISELRAPGANANSGDLLEQGVRSAHRKFVTGVTVVAGTDGYRKPYGLVVNAFMSVSLSPPTIMVCVGKSSRSHDLFLQADAFSVNILAADQADVARRFASAETDKFASVDWQFGMLGTPLLANCSASFEARVNECVRASTHTIFVGSVSSAQSSERSPLIYMAGGMYDSASLAPLKQAHGG
jgi:steroid delta-isomerase-like uncharacterized protein